MHLELIRDVNKKFPTIEKPDAISSAFIWHYKYQTLEPIRDMKNLETLVIANFPNSNFDFLKELSSLQYLRILHLPKVTSLSPLPSIISLISLSLETLPSWDASGKTTTVESLEPISKLPLLQHLQLFGVHNPSKSLSEIEDCKHLKTSRFSKYPKKEISRFQDKMGITDNSFPQPKYSNDKLF